MHLNGDLEHYNISSEDGTLFKVSELSEIFIRVSIKSRTVVKRKKKSLSDCWKVCAYFDLPLSSLSCSLSIFYNFRLDNPWFFLRRYLYNRIRSPILFLIILYAVCRMQLFQYIWRYDDSQNGFKHTELRFFSVHGIMLLTC